MQRLAVVGSMLAKHPGLISSAGELLAGRLGRAGYPVTITSTVKNKPLRLAGLSLTLARRRDIDVQILQVYGGPSFIAEDVASWIGRRAGHKLIMHVHGGAMPEFIARHPRWSRRVLRRADAFVTPSPFLARALAQQGYTARVIPNAVDIDRYAHRRRAAPRPKLFWMRAFDHAYNPAMALRVLAEVKQQLPEATLVMAGQDTGEGAAIKRMASEMGLMGSVRFPGYLSFDAKIAEANAADIFINTNHIDNAPVSFIEMAAMGLPIVATRVGGIADLVAHEQTALLVPDDDHAAMASAIVRLVKDERLASTLSANGRQMAEGYAWERVLPAWQRLFDEVTCEALTAGKAAA